MPKRKTRSRRRQLLVDHSLGSRIAHLRKARGLSQRQLAVELRIKQPMLSGYETGRVRLHGDVIVALTKILHVTSDELLGIEPLQPHLIVKDRRLIERVIQIDQLPKRKKDAILLTIQVFLAEAASTKQSATSHQSA